MDYRDVTGRYNSACAAAAVPAGGRSFEFRAGTNVAVIMQKSRARREYRACGETNDPRSRFEINAAAQRTKVNCR
jgi:hypothetical protein